MAKGDELLIADSNERDREGLRKLFTDQGYVCTCVKEMDEARHLVQQKFFPAALLDLDFHVANGGIELARIIREKSRPTSIVLLAGRRSFEAAVDGLRLGVSDVVNKRPDQIAHLTAAVGVAIDRSRAGSKDGSLLRDVRSVLDDAFKIMLAMGRKIYDDASPSGQSVGGPANMMKPTILVIDEDHKFLQELAGLLTNKPWEVSVELSGGSGLDRASTFQFQIVAVRDQLMDLPGQMVIKSAQGQNNKTLGIVYSSRGEGRIERYEGGRVTNVEQPLKGPAHLVATMESMVNDLSALRRERRYLQAFRADHPDFLKRYAELKARIDSLT